MESANGTGLKEESVKEQRLRRRREARIEAHRQRSNQDRLLIEFQPDAVELEKQPVPGGARWTLYTVIALITTFVFWANWAEVDKIVRAEGKLLTTEAPVIVDAKLSTPIKALNAKFGDRVSAGFVIATLDPTFSDADLDALESQKRSLDAKVARLTAERKGEPFSIEGHENDRDWLIQYRLFNERKSQKASELKKFSSQESTFQVQLENTRVQMESQLENFRKYKRLEMQYKELEERGSKSETDVMSRELQSSESKMQYITSKSRERELLKSIEALDAEREAFVAGWRTEVVAEMAQANDQYNSIENELLKANRSNEFVEVKVPEDLPYKEFVVLEVSEKSVGSIAQPGEPLFKLIPVDVPMEVEVDISGKDVAMIRAASKAQLSQKEKLPSGSDVRIKLASFPYQKHGTLDGAIRTISEGTFEKQMPGGMGAGMTTYRARVKIFDPGQLEHLPENFRLMPGMAATAEIKVGRRKVIEYFLYPLIRYMDDSFREP